MKYKFFSFYMDNIVSFIAGLSTKMYDDLEDNEIIQNYKTPYIMEVLKGIQFITFTTISLEDPLLFMIVYISAIFINFADRLGFNKPYEKSLFVSYFLLFFIIDYSKITPIHFLEYCGLIFSIIWLMLETLVFKEEVSYYKLIYRINVLIFYVLLFMYVTSLSKTMKHLLIYSFGYFLFSVIVQSYSLWKK